MHGMPLPALLSGCALLPSPLGQIHREVGKVNDTMFVKGLGRQVHQQMRTKTDSFPEAADRVSHASHASPRSRPGCSRPWALAKGEKPLIRKQEGKKKHPGLLKDRMFNLFAQLWLVVAPLPSRNRTLTLSPSCSGAFPHATWTFSALSLCRAREW